MTIEHTTRAGRYEVQIGGYRAFLPTPLPPDPPLTISKQLWSTLSDADQAVGRLDASAAMLPNPDLFIGMYVRKEAVLSSQIEGTQASLDDILEYEVARTSGDLELDIGEVFNYVRALNLGLEQLDSLPLSNRLLRNIHRELLSGVRGADRSPGEFRRSQNWIGPSALSLADAVHVSPPPHELQSIMGRLEQYMNAPSQFPAIINAGLIHAQFETIHPFLDGNGRMGRLLITFYLCAQGVLERPLLYLSAYFKRYREEYYSRLQSVRANGDWEGWLQFFTTAVLEVAREAATTARDIIDLREQHRQLIQDRMGNLMVGLQLLDLFYEETHLTVRIASDRLNVSYPTANGLMTGLEELGITEETTGQARYRVYRYSDYLELLRREV